MPTQQALVIRQPMHGQGLFKRGYRGARKHKVISRGLKGAAPFLGPKYGTAATVAGTVAGMLGFGMGPAPRRRRAPARKKAPKRRPRR